MLGVEGKAESRMPTVNSRVRKSPLSSMKRGDAVGAWRTRAKCQSADTGQRGDGKVKKEMSAPRALWSVLDLGRNSFAEDRSAEKERW